MSGNKYAEFRLQEEQAAKLGLLQEIQQTKAEAEALRDRITNALAGASPGLRETFHRETQAARGFLQSLHLPETGRLNLDSALETLRTVQQQLRDAVSKGREVHKAVVVAYTQRADDLGKQSSERWAEVELLYLSRKTLLNWWCGESQTLAWEAKLKAAQASIAEQRYNDAERALGDLRTELQEKGALAQAQEEKHQKRLYLLKALQQVCAEMRFKVVDGPRPEREDDRGSRILYTVDTLDRGKIVFALSLDMVNSFSEVEDAHCFEDFDRLSEFLDKKFGILTQFESEEGKTRPQLKHAEQKALPRTQRRSASKH